MFTNYLTTAFRAMKRNKLYKSPKTTMPFKLLNRFWHIRYVAMVLPFYIIYFLSTFQIAAQLKMGGYNVGFTSALEKDYTRSFGNSDNGLFSARPIQINIWYPTAQKGIKRMSIGDYCNLYLYQYNFSKKQKKEIDNNISLWKETFKAKGINNTDSLLKLKTNALLDADFPQKRHPVVMYIPGAEGEGFENFLLCEYLASYGYVVVSCPSFGPYDDQTSVYPLGIETQVADINFLYGYLSKLSFADKTKVNLAGFSMGGLTTIVFAMQKQEEFISIISIDGSIRTHYEKAKNTPKFIPQQFHIPFLLFASNGENWSDTLFINRIKFANTYLAKVDSLSHLDFTSYNYFGNNEIKRKSYEAFCLLTKEFLEKTRNNDTSELKGISDKTINISYKAGEKIKPVSSSTLKKMIADKGIFESKQYYNQIMKIEPSLQLFDEWEFTVLAFKYFNVYKKPDDSIEIMKLVANAYPESYKAIGLLGRLYEKNNDKVNAFLYYTKALQRVQNIDVKSPPILEDIQYYTERVKANSY